MKRVLKISGITLLGLLLLVLSLYGVYWLSAYYSAGKRMGSLGPKAALLQSGGHTYRDLNKNGKLDPYEDRRNPVDLRVEDLLSQMTLEEKAGCMFVGMMGMTESGKTIETPILSSNPLEVMTSNFIPYGSELIAEKKMNSFAPLGAPRPGLMARFNNHLQEMAERTRLGIPVTLASDPRHGVEFNPGIAMAAPGFSPWPGPLGLAATRDTLLVWEFGNVARQEYVACGIRVALHPMADLATEPRWSRVSGTFGEDLSLATAMLRNYIRGFQGDSLHAQSVACMAKHFPGSGTHTEGHEPHFKYGAEQSYSGDNFKYHVDAFAKGTSRAAQIMTSYGIPTGQTSEEVAVAFNRDVISGLLRDSLGFSGVVCTDWNVITDTWFMNLLKGGSSSWGVEGLSPIQRMEKVIRAGADQFGGESSPGLIVQLVREGKITEERINLSVKRVLRDKFRLGLFDNPYVDEDRAEQIAGNSAFEKKGKEAQRKSVVMLKNSGLLPLPPGTKIYAEGIRLPGAIDQFGGRVSSVEEADVIVKHIDTPYEPKDDFLMETFLGQHGRLYFNEEEKSELLSLVSLKPSIVIINLKRPAILTPIIDHTGAFLAEFGTSDEVLMEVLFGRVNPTGKLPFELPSSWQAVEEQLEDQPYDSKDPLFPFGYGLSYAP